MNFLTKSLFLLVATGTLFFSCKNDSNTQNNGNTTAQDSTEKKPEPKPADPVADNADIAKLSDASKKFFEEDAKSFCGCAKEHGKDLKAFLDEATPLVSDAKADLKTIEPKMKDAQKKLTPFNDCMKKSEVKRDDATKKAIEEDMKKLLGEKPELAALLAKQMEIRGSYISRDCADNSEMFKSFADISKKVSELRKNGK